MRIVFAIILCGFLCVQFSSNLSGQNFCVGNCDFGQSSCYYDTLSTSTSTLSIVIEGQGMCCQGFQNGNSQNYNCAQMFITVPPGTEGLEFGYNGPNQCAIDVHELQNGCPNSRNNGTSICDPFCPNTTTFCEGEPNAESVTFIFTLCKEGNFNPITIDITGVPKVCLELEDTNEDCDVTFYASPGSTWSSNPSNATNYLSCTSCPDPTFSYTGSPVTDCNGLQLEYTVSIPATACDVATSLTKTMLVYPTLDGIITGDCEDDCQTELTYTPDVSCPDIVFDLLNDQGDTLSNNTTGIFIVPSDNQQYSITASRPGTPECWNTEVYTAAPETVPPVLINFPSDLTLYYNTPTDPDTTTANTGYPGATDNCDLNPTVGYSDDTSGLTGCSNTGLILRTFIATDDCGNTSTQVQTLTILDTLAPVITTCPPDVNNITGCDTTDVNGVIGGLPYSPTPVVITVQQFTDVGGAFTEINNVTITYSDVITDNTCPNPIIVVTRTFVITDDCGNFDTCQQALEFVDYTEPEITCPPDNLSVDGCDENDVTVANTGLNYADTLTPVDNATYIALGGTINDVCGFLSIEYIDTIVPDVCPAATLIVTRTFLVTDECDNTETCVQTIQLFDLSGPEFLSHPDITVDCDSIPPYSDPIVEDACSGTNVTQISYQEDTISVTCINEFEITRTWVYADACSNTSTLVQTINVIDTIPPEIICPDDLTITFDNTCVIDTTLGFTGSPIINNTCLGSYDWYYVDDTTGVNTYNGHGTIVRTFFVSDDCGNTDSCQQSIELTGHFCGDGCATIYTNGFLRYNRRPNAGN